ncbi:EamA family transporter [Methanocalculus taiwanensis]|uniref:EamA family transporter n=1 Tax=Methanocalculus taiwanensis TaxID=106207 RepID=A0ABD4TGL1_9EURY|nr:DMT family transporter [Methanocalculus taiwanensis]MCQ1538107.1 EamA family transporter [Methanocalculus taiwanensis]
MFWFLFALGGAVSQAAYAGMVKRLLTEKQIYPLAGYSFLSASFFLFAIVLFVGIPVTGAGLAPAVLGTVFINIIATILLYRALTRSDLSLCVPMLAFTPVFLLVTSFLILGEVPQPAGAIGMVLVAAGAYILHLDPVERGPAALATPFRRLFSDRGVQSMLGVAFLFSISVNFDKQVVENSDPFFGSVLVFLLLALAFLSLSALDRRRRKDAVPATPLRLLLAYPAVGFVLVWEIVLINLAYTMAIVPYVISVKRLAIVFSVLFGLLIFHEEFSWGRILGAIIMVAGAGMIAVFG